MSLDRRAAHRDLIALSAPIAGTQLATVVISSTDVALMGGLGVTALAAGGLAVTVFNQVRTMGVGLLTPVGNEVAVAHTLPDAGRTEDRPADFHARDAAVRGAVRAGFLVSTVAALLGIAVIVGVGLLLPLLGQDAQVASGAWPALLAFAPGLLPYFWFQCLRQYTVGMRRPRALLLITVASIALNAAVSAGLAYGLGMGVVGIALGTTVVQVATLAWFGAAVRRDAELAPLLAVDVWHADRAATIRLLRLGVPTAATYGSEAGLFSVLALLMGVIGPEALAAHTAAYQIIFLVFQVAIGLSQGGSILVSRAVAQRDPATARDVARAALTTVTAVVAVVGAVYLMVPGPVIAAFTGGADTATRDVAASLLLVGVVMQFADAAQNIGVGMLRGLADTAAAFRISVVGYWLVGLPLAVLLAFGAGLDGPGIWLGLTAGLATTAVLLHRRFARTLARLAPG
ncbi:MATE family efflux transporter [Tsukamurella sp. 8F]|uniref:MATE family efflux transporter n=1 Tax=unclassified Tsukamurella TaxID=2633480 RepID=UPI0023B8931B|nr:MULTISPECIES: MATE family efflux transporter [unclassified Tsukamurella]MDF0531950.1 MATE family efflux transporter [Tsukamurella sp. 8J]MDF0587999.1 MATE family efflux transporter [Tsukamurella sp. 8F]